MGIYSDVLLTVDFDRTLTAPDSSIPERNLEAIRYFMKEGGIFTINTGRSVPMFRRYMDAVPVNAPLLLYNGGAAYENGRLTQVHPINLDISRTIARVEALFPDLSVELQGIDAHYCFRDDPVWHTFCGKLGCAHRQAKPEDAPGPFLKFSLLGEIRGDTVANLFQGSPEDIARMDAAEAVISREFGNKVQVFRAGARIVDVQAAGVSKARSAQELQARLGRKFLVCVGDGENDVSMLDSADFAFCPADAVVADRYPNACACARGAVAEVIYKKIPEILGK